MRKYKLTVFSHELAQQKPATVLDLEIRCMPYDLANLVKNLRVAYDVNKFSINTWKITETQKLVNVA
jgi:hypothetical protein